MFKWMIALAVVGSMAIVDMAYADKLDAPKSGDEQRVKIEKYLVEALLKKAPSLPDFTVGIGIDTNSNALLRAATETPPISKVRTAAGRRSIDLAPVKLAKLAAPELAEVVRPVLCTSLPCGKDWLS